MSYNLAHPQVKVLRPEAAVEQQPLGLLKLTHELGIDMTHARARVDS